MSRIIVNGGDINPHDCSLGYVELRGGGITWIRAGCGEDSVLGRSFRDCHDNWIETQGFVENSKNSSKFGVILVGRFAFSNNLLDMFVQLLLLLGEEREEEEDVAESVSGSLVSSDQENKYIPHKFRDSKSRESLFAFITSSDNIRQNIRTVLFIGRLLSLQNDLGKVNSHLLFTDINKFGTLELLGDEPRQSRSSKQATFSLSFEGPCESELVAGTGFLVCAPGEGYAKTGF